MRRVMFVAAVYLSAAAPAMALPSRQVSELMATPVSLFSFGMTRLGKEAAEIVRSKPSTTRFIPFVKYDPHLDVITIIFRSIGIQNFEDECARMVQITRFQGAVVEGKPVGGAASRYSKFFMPDGYEIEGIGVEQQQAIDKTIKIVVEEIDGSKTCVAPLIGTGYSIEKQ